MNIFIKDKEGLPPQPGPKALHVKQRISPMIQHGAFIPKDQCWFFYIASTDHADPEIKLGISKVPNRRLVDLNTSRRDPLILHCAVPLIGRGTALNFESSMARDLADFRARGEVFEGLDLSHIVDKAITKRYLMLPVSMRPFPVFLSGAIPTDFDQFELEFDQDHDGSWGIA